MTKFLRSPDARRNRLYATVLAGALLAAAFDARADCGRDGNVRIAFGTTLAPYSIEKTADGIEVDIVREALRRQGCTLAPVFLPFVRAEYALAENKIDGVATTNRDSGIQAQYSLPYVEYHNVAVTLKSRRLRIEHIADLKGHRIASFPTATRYLGEQFRRFANSTPLYREEPKQINQNRLLYLGGADVVIAELNVFNHLDRSLDGSKFPERAQAVVVHRLFPPNPYQIAFRNASLRDKFNAGFSSLSSEELKAIYDRYR